MLVKNVNLSPKLLKRVNRHLSIINDNYENDKIYIAYQNVLNAIYNLQRLLDNEIK